MELALSNLVTALVPSETACLESSPGSMRRTEVWICGPLTLLGYLRHAILEMGGFPGFYGNAAFEPLRRELVEGLEPF